MKTSRTIGASIYTLLKNNNRSAEDLSQYLGYMKRDITRILEGRLLVTPRS